MGDPVEPVHTSVQIQGDRDITRKTSVRYRRQCSIDYILPSERRDESLGRSIRGGQ